MTTLAAKCHQRNKKCHALIGQLKLKYCNVVVNISYQTIKQPRNVLKAFWKRFKIRRKSRRRFGNLKCAAKVVKENSCSL